MTSTTTKQQEETLTSKADPPPTAQAESSAVEGQDPVRVAVIQRTKNSINATSHMDNTTAPDDDVDDDNNKDKTEAPPPPSKTEEGDDAHPSKTDKEGGEQQEAASPKKDDDDNDDNDNDWMVQRDQLKSMGDNSFRNSDYENALFHYTQALTLDPNNGVLLSNRSAAYLKNNEKSKALADAKACLPSMGIKGISRYAAALQSLGRYGQALIEWKKILKQDTNHVAATHGRIACEKAIAEQQERQRQQKEAEAEAIGATEKKKETEDKDGGGDDDDDLLDDFFNEVEEVAETVVQKRIEEAEPVAIKNQKKDLGDAQSQIARLIPDNYQWYNLNPFHVLDLPHTSTIDDISRRYKALSLLLHPDKNPNVCDKAQLAYDQVQKAKETLYDEDKVGLIRQLIEQGMEIGKSEWEQQSKHKHTKDNVGVGVDDGSALEEIQRKAVHKIFADIEYKRRQLEKRERAFQQREQKQQDDELAQEQNEMKFDKKWKQTDRVDKRVGNWRDFQQKKKQPKKT